RLRAHRRADAAGGARRAGDAPPDPALLDRAGRFHAAARGHRPVRGAVPRLSAGARRRLLRPGRAALGTALAPRLAAALPLLARLPCAAVLRDGRRQGALSRSPDALIE